MKGRLRILTFLLLTLTIIVLVSWAGWRLWLILSPPIERVCVDFADIRRTGKPNDYLVCPPGFCGSAADDASPVFEIPVLQLKQEWLGVVSRQPRVESLSGSEGLQLEFEQRSWLFDFPDTINVRFFPLAEQRSTLAVYSRSHYGYADLNVNRKRIELWLRQIEQSLARKGLRNRSH